MIQRSVSRPSRHRRAAAGAAVVAAFVAGLQGAAEAAERPRTAPAALEAPAKPATPPRVAASRSEALAAELDHRTVALTAPCTDSGRAKLTRHGRRLAAGPLRCDHGRAELRLKLVHRAGATGPARLTTIAGGERARHAVVVRPAQALARRSGDFSRVPYVWCTGVGFSASVDTTMRFGAAYGETVWWRPIGLEYRNGRYAWRLGDRWSAYRAHPGDGQFLYDAATGRMELGWTVVQSQHLTVSAYGTLIRPGLQVYTQRGGYEWAFIGATYVQGYAEQATDWCNVPSP